MAHPQDCHLDSYRLALSICGTTIWTMTACVATTETARASHSLSNSCVHGFAFALAQDADELDEGAGVPLHFKYEVTTGRSTYSWTVLPSGGGSTRAGKEDPESEVGRCMHAPLLTGQLSLFARETEIFVLCGRRLIV